MTKSTNSLFRACHLPVAVDSTNLRKHLLGLCCCVSLVSLAVPPAFAQTPPEPVKSTDSAKPKDPAVAQSDQTKTPPSSSTTPTSVGTTRSTPVSSADDFIPGSEVLPTPEKSTAQSEEFVKSQKPTMDLAMVLYKNNEFKQSLLVLSRLPQTEQVHYYTGLCYKGMGNVKDATTHFAWVAYYAKDPKLKSYAFAAIRSTKPNRLNIKKDPGNCNSSIYTSAEAKIRSEELQHRIKMKEEGVARQRELSGGF